jgi:hypothetical protein
VKREWQKKKIIGNAFNYYHPDGRIDIGLKKWWIEASTGS